MKRETIEEALKIMNLLPPVSLKEIKERYRELTRLYHPDTGGENKNPEEFDKISKAYKVLRDYCENFKFTFSETEIFSQFPEEKLLKRFKGSLYWEKQ